MNRDTLYNLLVREFAFAPTEGQARVLYHLSAFLLSEKQRPLYLLQGYAGTGKTSLIRTLTHVVPHLGMKVVLLAPTGRAAKVMSSYSGAPASTMHRRLYHFSPNNDGTLKMSHAKNNSRNTLFIVDECSMIPDDLDFGNGHSLLNDLIEYVFSAPQCRLLLIGDIAQLPPIGLDISPANDINHLKTSYDITAHSFNLTEVMRQSLNSGILENATIIRNRIEKNDFHRPIFNIKNFSDIIKISPETFEELLNDAFGKDKDDNDSIIICKSNKRANLFNQAIRSRILQEEGELSVGDRLMIVKNNYFWTDESNNINFLANGDMIEILRINNFETLYDFHFADVEIRLIDYPDSPNLSVKILLETLTSDSPALTKEEANTLYNNIADDYADLPTLTERRQKMKTNPWLNALQVKFGYALTCHKTQGGQWRNVFIDAPYKAEDEDYDRNDFRWLYTALTRAIDRCFLVNFKEDFFEK